MLLCHSGRWEGQKIAPHFLFFHRLVVMRRTAHQCRLETEGRTDPTGEAFDVTETYCPLNQRRANQASPVGKVTTASTPPSGRLRSVTVPPWA